MKALITGAGGFSGSHLLTLLRSKKISVAGFKGDLRDETNTLNQVRQVKPDWIFHLASPLRRTDSLIDDSLVTNLETDLFGSIYLLRAAAGLKIKPKILITGTNAVYAPKNRPLQETDPLGPTTAYGLSKFTQETIGARVAAGYNLPLIMTRTFHLVGPGQRPGFVVPDIINQIKAGRISLGNPAVKRDFTDVRDACRAYYLLMKKGQPGEIYNVCSGKATPIGTIAEKLIVISGRRLTVKAKKSWRRHDPSIIRGDNHKLTRLGWKPQIALDQSLKDAYEKSN